MILNRESELNSQEVVYTCMRYWEYDMGEDFLDNNCSLVDSNFYQWLFDKKYITEEKLKKIQSSGIWEGVVNGYINDGDLIHYADCEDEARYVSYWKISEYALLNENFMKNLVKDLYEYTEEIDTEKFDFSDEIEFAKKHSLKDIQFKVFDLSENLWKDRVEKIGDDYDIQELKETREFIKKSKQLWEGI